MPPPRNKIKTVREDNPFVIVTRETDGDNVAITQSGMSTITYMVFLVSDGSTQVSQTSLTIANVVFDTYQTGGVWVDDNGDPEDTTGYNFKHTLPGSVFPTAGQVLQVEHVFTPASGNAFTSAFYRITVIERKTG